MRHADYVVNGKRPMWAPYHRDALIVWMTEAEINARLDLIRTSKPTYEVPARIAAFQPVLQPLLLPATFYNAACKVVAQDDSGFFQLRALVRAYWYQLEYQRQEEYPDTVAYSPLRGLVFEQDATWRNYHNQPAGSNE